MTDIDAKQAALELTKRRRARDSLLAYTEYTLPSFESAKHHAQIAEALESVERGDCKRLMIYAPPRHTKSELSSRRFPSWYLGRNPHKQIIATTYGHDFASDFGRDVRNIINSDEYQRVFDTRLRSDSQSANRWHTDKDGVYISTGVGGSITGRGAHCFPAGTMVSTPSGNVDISNIERGMLVSTCDTKTGIILYRKVLATRSKHASRLIEIGTSTGKLIRATPEHPFYIPSLGWVRADELKEGYKVALLDGGDELPDMQKACSEKLGGGEEGGFLGEKVGLLFARMQQGWGKRAPRQKVSDLLKAVPKLEVKRGKVLLRQLHTFSERAFRYIMRGLSCSLSSTLKKHHTLQQGMFRYSSLLQDAGRRQFKLEAWRRVQQALQTIAGRSKGEGSGGLCGMRRQGGPSCGASYRREQEEQQSGEFDNDVQRVPCNAPQIKEDTISSVTRVSCESVQVYDIQVEETSCFFADSILVHNCALIDDPFKNREDADSEVYREKVWKWYTSTLYTRLMPGGAIILIMTRWHEDDLAGRLLEAQKQGGDQWTIVNLQAIANEGTDREKALWPEWYNLDYLKQVKRVVGARDWSALYQQSPTADEGTFFKREWFKRYTLGEQPQTNKYQSTDFAVTDDGGDYTELGIIGLCSDMDLWVEDWWSGQTTSDVWIDAMLEQIKKHSPLCSFGETGVIRRAVEPLFRMMGRQKRVYPRIEWITRTGDKAAVARALQGMAANGKVHIPSGEWGDRLIEQLVAFPAGKHDDAVDVLALFALAIQTANPAILVDNTVVHRDTDCWGRFKSNDGDSWRTA